LSHYKAKVGNVDLISITDGHAPTDPTRLFPDSSLDQWIREYPELMNDNGLLDRRLGSAIVRSENKIIIVDTGLNAPGGTLLEDMRSKGVDIESVQLVVLTHLDPDHVGWNLTDGRPTFPGARYLVPKQDWEYWTQPRVLEDALHISEQVIPLDEQRVMDLMDAEYKITGELTAIPTPGHTPGHMSILVSSAGEKGCILGDVAHSPAQAKYTDWSPVFDVDLDLARRTRELMLNKLEAEAMVVSAGHFPGTGFGRFVQDKGRRVWQPL